MAGNQGAASVTCPFCKVKTTQKVEAVYHRTRLRVDGQMIEKDFVCRYRRCLKCDNTFKTTESVSG